MIDRPSGPTEEPDRAAAPAATGPSDETLARLVRETAGEWTMPPRRVDTAAWRGRVRATGMPRARLYEAGWPGLLGRFGGRLGRPAAAAVSLAVVATLVVAFSAAIVTSRPGPASRSPNATTAASAGHSTQASPTPVSPTQASPTPESTASPSLEVFGGPIPDRQLVTNDGGQWRLLSIATGRLGSTIQPSTDGVNGGLFALPGGGFLCACTDTAYQLAGKATPGPSAALEQTLTVTVRVFDPGGRLLREGALPPYVGAQDPSDSLADSKPVASYATLGPDGRTLYLGWIARSAGGWRNGVDVVDVAATPRVVQSVPLDTVPLTEGGVGLLAWTGPQVMLAPDGRHMIVTRPLDIGTQGGEAIDRFSAPIAGGRVGSMTKMSPATLATGSCSPIGPQGFAGPTAVYGLCQSGTSVVLRRVDLAGALLGDTTLPAAGPMGYYGSLATDRTGTTMYVWGPGTGTLTRIDLGSGRITGSLTIPVTTASSAYGPLGDLLGRLVPGAVAKEILDPSIALTPDGRRLYLLGTTSTDPATPGDSTGVWVVDAGQMRLVDHWARPRADLMSIAVTPDGAFVVAAGFPGMNGGPDDRSSISVYDAATGRLRLFAPQVSSNELFFSRMP